MNIDSSVRYLYANDPDNNLVHIKDAKRYVQYTCPNCKDGMIPKLGEIRAWHFAHKTHVCPFNNYKKTITELKNELETRRNSDNHDWYRPRHELNIVPQEHVPIVNHKTARNKKKCACYDPIAHGFCAYYRPAQRKGDIGFFCAKTNPYDGPKCPVHINPADEVFKRD